MVKYLKWYTPYAYKNLLFKKSRFIPYLSVIQPNVTLSVAFSSNDSISPFSDFFFISLHWNEFLCKNINTYNILGYVLNLKSVGSEWQEISLDYDLVDYTIEGTPSVQNIEVLTKISSAFFGFLCNLSSLCYCSDFLIKGFDINNLIGFSYLSLACLHCKYDSAYNSKYYR